MNKTSSLQVLLEVLLSLNEMLKVSFDICTINAELKFMKKSLVDSN